MSIICPVCNGFYRLNLTCSCGSPLEDRGRLEDYAGPYSPYQGLKEDLFPEEETFESPEASCVHLMSCRDCNKDERVAVTQREA